MTEAKRSRVWIYTIMDLCSFSWAIIDFPCNFDVFICGWTAEDDSEEATISWGDWIASLSLHVFWLKFPSSFSLMIPISAFCHKISIWASTYFLLTFCAMRLSFAFTPLFTLLGLLFPACCFELFVSPFYSFYFSKFMGLWQAPMGCFYVSNAYSSPLWLLLLMPMNPKLALLGVVQFCFWQANL